MVRLIIIFLLVGQQCLGQIISPERRVDWTKAGLSKIHVEPERIVTIEQFGGKGDGLVVNNKALEEAISSFGEKGGLIQFGEGEYLFNKSFHVPDSIVLRGLGSDVTIIKFGQPASGDLIQVKGRLKGTPYDVSTSALKGQQYIISSFSNNVSPWDYFKISKIDSALITSDWALGTVGQIVRVTEIRGDTLKIDAPLRLDYPLETDPKIQQIVPCCNVGIECMRIRRGVNDAFQSSTILMEYATNCYINGVEMDSCNYAHVTFSASSHCAVRNSYFHDAYSYGGGGKGYGIMVQNTSGDCLIENNIFRHLRHSMILQAGSNGNVFGYNYSIDPYWTEVSLPSNAAGDIVLHGNYVYANLFEGNLGQQIVIDDSHGINGPYNTFFRNRLELYGIFMNNNPATNDVNFVGNEVTNSAFTYGLYLLSGKNHFQYANNIRGTVTPTGTENLNDTSYYLRIKPNFLQQTSQYPVIGSPNVFKSGEIPAKLNYIKNQPTSCSEDSTMVASYPTSSNYSVLIYPNPVGQIIFLKGLNSVGGKVDISIYNSEGRLVQERKGLHTESSIEVSTLVTGFYIVRIRDTNKNYIGRFVKL